MITIGADPEVFLVSKENRPVSSIGKIGGTKEHPIHIQNGIFLQEDNVTVEYNIPPCSDAEAFLAANKEALKIIQEKAQALDLGVSIQAAYTMPKKELNDPRAWVFGCEPDFNVHSLDWNPKPDPTAVRAAGGHVHIGFEGENLDKINLTKMLDATLGAVFTFLDPDIKRKKLYGLAGSIRFKPYGIEYRTLSNYWLTHPFYIKTVFDVAHFYTTHVKNDMFHSMTTNKLVNAINKRNIPLLKKHIKELPERFMIPRTLGKLIEVINEATKDNELDHKRLQNYLNALS